MLTSLYYGMKPIFRLSMKMPPKGRKSLSSWHLCESCGALVGQKDLQVHSVNSCPPDSRNWVHGFIKDEILYSFLEETKSTDLVGALSENVRNGLVLLSQSGMQLCKICIGESVIVTYNHYSEIKTAWPTSERSLTSVGLTKEAMQLYNGTVSVPVIINKIKTSPLPAKEIYFGYNDEINYSTNKLSALFSTLKCSNKNRIICVGNKIQVPFFGKSIKLEVEKITNFHLNEEEFLVKNIEDLNLEQNSKTFYKWTSATKLVLDKKNTPKQKDEELNIITMKNIGGYKDIVREMEEIIALALGFLPSPHDVPPSFGVLLYGPNGTGKTTVAKALANSSKANIVNVQSGELFSKYYGETEARLRSCFKEALQQSPSIILIEDVDTLCSKKGSSDQERRVVSTMLTLLDSLQDRKVLVLATTSKLHLIDPALRRPGRLDREIELSVPSPWDRLDILNVQLSAFHLDSTTIKEVADMAHGYVAADLSALVSRACTNATRHGRNTLIASDLHWAITQVKPSAMREVLVQVPNVNWSDIGGQEDLKLKLRQAVEWPLHHPEAFLRLGISPPRGVLMFGPPGCSKTMIAKALATESKLNFLSIKGSELFSKWVGESERAVRELFKRARSVAPSIIFFDELDAIGGERAGAGSGGSNVQERVLAQLLTELDGVEPLGNVTVVAATNRPDRIDKALLRPGRLDCLMYVPLPDLCSREQILQLQFKKTPIADDVQIDELAKKMEGYSGAEVVAVCHEAALGALQENLNATVVNETHFLSAMKVITPRTPSSLLELYQNYLQT